MERPTKTIELPLTKKSVVLKEWLTGREYEMTQTPLYESYKKDMKAGIDLQSLTHQTFNAYVVSVDGVNKDILNLILDLPHEDYTFIIEQINDIKKKI
jgi:hypothetical protein